MEWIKIDEEGELVLVEDEVKLVPEVQALLSSKYNKKGRAMQEFKYLFLAYSYKSPYRDFSEKERIAEIRCPSCGAKVKEHYINQGTNGVIGPGRSSWLIEEYYICKGCGIHYSDLNKKEIAKPYKGFL